MSVMIQFRNVPADLQGAPRARVALGGMSLPGFIKRELRRSAEVPTIREWLDRTSRATPVPGADSAQIIRMARDSR